MKEMLGQPWFWFLVLLTFLGVILWDDDFEKGVQSKYAKQKMKLTDVHFSEIDRGFEHARMYADVVDIDDSQNNMYATEVRSLFFDRKIATRTGELIASHAFKTPFEARFWGDVKMRSSDGERMRTNEMRYFFSRKEMYTSMPVTIWKDDMIITGSDFRFNTQTKAGSLNKDVLIRIWKSASSTSATSSGAVEIASGETGHLIMIPDSVPDDIPDASETVNAPETLAATVTLKPPKPTASPSAIPFPPKASKPVIASTSPTLEAIQKPRIPEKFTFPTEIPFPKMEPESK